MDHDPGILIRSGQASRQLHDDIKGLVEKCKAEHGKEHVSQCPTCYSAVLQRWKKHYFETVEPQWFDRRYMLGQLDILFADAQAGQATADEIHQFISSDKEQWVRERLKSFIFHHTTASLLGKEATDSLMLRSDDESVPKLLEDLGEALRPEGVTDEDIEQLIARLQSARIPQEQAAVWKEALFGATVRPEHRKYADKLDAGVPVQQVMQEVQRDAADDAKVQAANESKKAELRKKIEGLQRAKNAKAKQTTSRKAAKEKASAVPKKLYDLPACAHCGGPTSPQKFLACPMCTVLEDLGATATKTVYCSEKCHEQGYDGHLEKTHVCASGQRCVVDEDVEMEGTDDDGIVLCRRCIGLRKPTAFCSARCYQGNFQRHREDTHLDEDYKDTLEYDSQDPSVYHAKNIADHCITMEACLVEYEERNNVKAER